MSVVVPIRHYARFFAASIDQVPRRLFVRVFPSDAAGVVLAGHAVAIVGPGKSAVDNPTVVDFDVAPG